MGPRFYPYSAGIDFIDVGLMVGLDGSFGPVVALRAPGFESRPVGCLSSMLYIYTGLQTVQRLECAVLYIIIKDP